MGIVDTWLQKSFQDSIPLQVSLELTHRCNLRCSHCYIESYQDIKVLTLQEWEEILWQLREAGALYLVLMGGEPTLSPHLVPIVKLASRMGFYTSIITNGIELISGDLLDNLITSGINSITFSLYSMDETLHEQMIQKKGVHTKLLKIILKAKSLLRNITVNTLLTKENIEKALDVAHWCEQNKLQFNFDPQPTGWRAQSASKEQLETFYNTLVTSWPEAKPAKRELSANDPICNIARGKCAIDPSGNLLGCVEMRTVLGNLTEKSFSEVWQNDETVSLRSFYNKDMRDDSSFCSHCPAMSLQEKGTPFEITEKNNEISSIRKTLWK